MKPPSWCLVPLLVLACTACDPPRIEGGFYFITHHSQSDTNCEQPGEDVSRYSMLSVSYLGEVADTYIVYAKNDWEDVWEFIDFWDIGEPVGDEWVRQSIGVSWPETTSCKISAFETRVRVDDEGAFKIERRRRSTTLEIDSFCPDVSTFEPEELPCEEYTVMEATPRPLYDGPLPI